MKGGLPFRLVAPPIDFTYKRGRSIFTEEPSWLWNVPSAS
jgi:hypothetical protein